jgi:hypothetical protein
MTVKEVAVQMQLSAKTISTYRTRLLEKMVLDTNADLVRYVVEHDLMKYPTHPVRRTGSLSNKCGRTVIGVLSRALHHSCRVSPDA